MKNLFFLLFIISMAISCGKEDLNSTSRDCREVEYDISFDFRIADKVCFPDGNSLILTNIEHGFCPCLIDCDWEGGLYISLSASASGNAKEKKFFLHLLDRVSSIFDSHKIAPFSHKYDSESEEVPACREDFEAEKITLSFTISKL